MAVYKNKSQTIAVYAKDGAGEPKTGDAANITAQINKDGNPGASIPLTAVNPTEIDSTNHPGWYAFDLTADETNGDMLILSPKSTTLGVKVLPLQIFTEPEQRDANVREVAGTVQTAGDFVALLTAVKAKTDAALNDAGFREALGLTAANLDSQLGTLASTAALVKNKTDYLPDASPLTESGLRLAVGLAAANLDTQIATLATGANLTTVDTVVDAIKVVTDKVNSMLEADGLVFRFTVNALETAPAGGGGGTTDWTSSEREQIRSALGVDGTKTPAVGGQLQALSTESGSHPTLAEIEGSAVLAKQPKLDTLDTRLTAQRAGNLDNLDATVSSRTTPAQVNAEIIDALTVDVYAEPTQVPVFPTSILNMIRWVFTLGRNKQTVTQAGQTTVRNAADTANIATRTDTDNGTIYVKDRWV